MHNPGRNHVPLGIMWELFPSGDGVLRRAACQTKDALTTSAVRRTFAHRARELVCESGGLRPTERKPVVCRPTAKNLPAADHRDHLVMSEASELRPDGGVGPPDQNVDGVVGPGVSSAECWPLSRSIARTPSSRHEKVTETLVTLPRSRARRPTVRPSSTARPSTNRRAKACRSD